MKIWMLTLAAALSAILGCSPSGGSNCCGSRSVSTTNNSNAAAVSPAEMVANYARAYRKFADGEPGRELLYEQVQAEYRTLQTVTEQYRNANALAIEARKNGADNADQLEALSSKLFAELVKRQQVYTSRSQALFAANSKQRELELEAERIRERYAPNFTRNHTSKEAKALEHALVLAATVPANVKDEFEKRRQNYIQAYQDTAGIDAAVEVALKEMESANAAERQARLDFEKAAATAAHTNLGTDVLAARNAFEKMKTSEEAGNAARRTFVKSNQNWKQKNEAYEKALHEVLKLPLN